MRLSCSAPPCCPVLASLVLGLLIATAKSAYDATETALRNHAAELVLLAETLRDYDGSKTGQAQRSRDQLRAYTQKTITSLLFPSTGKGSLEGISAQIQLEHLRETIRDLKTNDSEDLKWQLDFSSILLCATN
jgi:hypothetical protein